MTARPSVLWERSNLVKDAEERTHTRRPALSRLGDAAAKQTVADNSGEAEAILDHRRWLRYGGVDGRADHAVLTGIRTGKSDRPTKVEVIDLGCCGAVLRQEGE
jgi:hypothetical protein